MGGLEVMVTSTPLVDAQATAGNRQMVSVYCLCSWLVARSIRCIHSALGRPVIGTLFFPARISCDYRE
jgi:hypothetical protein